mgnify:CR=1 FL=1
MKRQQYLGCLLASCVLILTACGTVQPISGQVVERTTEEDGTLSAFVVETHTGERISLTMTEKTRVFSWVDGVSGQDFAAGTLDGIAVSVVTGDPADLTAAGSTGLSAYEASEVQITQIRLAEEITLSDGTAVEIWQGELWGVLEVKSHGSLSEKELEAVKDYWSGQESDGWGEGFEQRPIQIEDGELYVSFWNSSDSFFITTEEQLKGTQMPELSMKMGGM